MHPETAAAASTPDAARGEQIYARCTACHALTFDRVGPRHCGLFGRRAGSVTGFDYSKAMKNSKITWNEKTLDGFLAKPLAMVPGTSMTYDGVPDPNERADLIAYLKQANRSAECSLRCAESRRRAHPRLAPDTRDAHSGPCCPPDPAGRAPHRSASANASNPSRMTTRQLCRRARRHNHVRYRRPAPADAREEPRRRANST